MSDEELEVLGIDSSLANLGLGVTGILLHADGRFLQLIEGGSSEIGNLADRIKDDPRHHRFEILVDETSDGRWSNDWFMRLAPATVADLALPPPLLPYVSASFPAVGK